MLKELEELPLGAHKLQDTRKPYPELYAGLLKMNRRAGVRGAQRAPTKIATTIRLSPEVMDAFKATGAGWQTRIDAALKDWLKTHKLA